jgi:hypothetical protein
MIIAYYPIKIRTKKQQIMSMNHHLVDFPPVNSLAYILKALLHSFFGKSSGSNGVYSRPSILSKKQDFSQ